MSGTDSPQTEVGAALRWKWPFPPNCIRADVPSASVTHEPTNGLLGRAAAAGANAITNSKAETSNTIVERRLVLELPRSAMRHPTFYSLASHDVRSGTRSPFRSNRTPPTSCARRESLPRQHFVPSSSHRSEEPPRRRHSPSVYSPGHGATRQRRPAGPIAVWRYLHPLVARTGVFPGFPRATDQLLPNVS